MIKLIIMSCILLVSLVIVNLLVANTKLEKEDIILSFILWSAIQNIEGF